MRGDDGERGAGERGSSRSWERKREIDRKRITKWANMLKS